MKREWWVMVWKKVMILGTALGVIAASGCQAGGGHDAVAAATAAANVELTDIGTHWAKDAILHAMQKGYVDGYEDRTFRPDQSVTRAEFIKMVVSAMKLKVGLVGQGDTWYTSYVNAAQDAYIERKEDFTSGDMNTPITRMEMSRIAVRATTKALQNPAMHMDDNSFVYNATKTGLIQGLAGGELGLDQATTRAQSVTIIERILRINDGGTLDVDKTALSYAEVNLRGTNAETVWGLRLVNLPMDIKNDQGVKMTLDKIIIVDMGDPNAAYYNWFKEYNHLNIGPHPDIKTEYLLGFHWTMKVENAGPNEMFKFPLRPIFDASAKPLGENASAAIAKYYSAFSINQIGTYDGWTAQTVDKSKALNQIKNYGYVNYRFQNITDNSEWFINPH
jgi:hypothetical protein